MSVNPREFPSDDWKTLKTRCLYNSFSLNTGRSLVRLTDNSLLRLEIVIPEHRQAILREISKLRLRSNILLLKDREMKLQVRSSTTTEVH